MGSYDDLLQIVANNIQMLTQEEQYAIWYDNAARVYRL